ncbi:MAG TPA: UBP-type zinc finger domain-containing protein [Pyrinomonadaceae bacterium]
MSEEDLEILVTLDDTGEEELPEVFDHQHPRNTLLMRGCSHLSQIKKVTPRTPDGCEECLALGDTWVHLRLCEICGHVGCCNSSKNKHSIKHFLETDHPVIKSYERGEDWRWCHVDEMFFAPAVEVMN